MSNGHRVIRRSRRHRVIAGVLGGIAEHFGFRPNVLRVLYVVGSVLSAAFPGIVVYVLLWILIPKQGS